MIEIVLLIFLFITFIQTALIMKCRRDIITLKARLDLKDMVQQHIKEEILEIVKTIGKIVDCIDEITKCI